jgi:hypothetical protein
MPGYQDAAAVAGRGLAVFPLPAGGKAAAPGWHRRCTADLELLARTWPYGANIGVGCRASGIAGVDLDRHGGPDGVATFAEVCARHGQPWPCTLTVATPSGGLHLYFTVPAGLVVPSVAGIWPGVDTRGPGLRLGGYLAGPGSVVGGRRYEIARDDPIAELPGWLAALITRGRTADMTEIHAKPAMG